MLPKLRIGHMTPRLPIVQGGMAVRVATGRLAAAVAENGGLGTIAGTGLTSDELTEEIRKARTLSSGYIGVNVLFAARQFAELMLTAMREKVDFVVSGAGFSRDMFLWGKEHHVPVLAIVSSVRLAKLAEKLGADAIVVEGKEAGGHLGTDRPIADIIPEVVAEVQIPVIAAGGITDGYDLARMFGLGASGVQIATRFVLSEECEAAPAYKQKYLEATAEEIILIDSPVGLPGRAIANPFTRALEMGRNLEIKKCEQCLKRCSARFCILDVLRKAVAGDMENGLIFAGEFVYRIKEILPVREIMAQLVRQCEQALFPVTV